MVMSDTPEVRAALEEIESAAAELCGQRNAITAQLVELVMRLDTDDLWESTGARSLEHWVAWKCGMSSSHAKDLVTTAQRARELPETMAGMAEGVISEDQVAVIARKAPDGMDHHFAELARSASVSQLHTALRIARQAQPPTPAPEPSGEDETSPPAPPPTLASNLQIGLLNSFKAKTITVRWFSMILGVIYTTLFKYPSKKTHVPRILDL